MTQETQLLDTQTRSHHPASPSSLQSSEACAHYKSQNRDSAASIAGVRQHKASETGDFSILESPEEVAAVTRYLAVVDKWRKRLEAAGALRIEVIKEVYLSVGDDVEIDESGVHWKGITGGYPDDILLATFEPGGVQLAVIIDAKFGKRLVTPTKSNLQGLSYSRAVMEKYPNVEEVAVQFYHPYIEVDEEGGVQEKPEFEHTFSREEYDAMELQIRYVVARKKKAGIEGLNTSSIPATPKTDLCLYCANMADCHALGKVLVLGASKHKDIVVPDVFNPNQLTTPVDYANAYRFANQFELVAKAIKKRVTDAAIHEDVNVPGFKLTRRKERVLGDSSVVKKTLVEAALLTEEEFDNCANVPITKVEELIKGKAAKGKGAAAVREFEHVLQEAGLLTTSDGYLYLRESKEEKACVEEKTLDI